MSRGKEESQMKLRGENREDNVRSVYFEEYKQEESQTFIGTSGGNADVNEMKSAFSQEMSRGQEESQMKLRGENSEDNVRSVYLEVYKQTSFSKEKIEENQELYHATPADLNVHRMGDSGIGMFFEIY
jgi:hypothetical protein